MSSPPSVCSRRHGAVTPSAERSTRRAGAGTLFSDSPAAQGSVARQLTDAQKMSRLAMTCWPQRHLFTSYGRGTPNEETPGLRKKYGEIAMHDLPKWTKDFFPGVYHLFHGFEAVMPYTHTHVHARYWDRWKTPEEDWNDVGRSVRILNAHRYTGTIALEWEDGPMDGIEGMRWLMQEVLAAL